MSTKRSRILVMALCAVGLLLWQAGSSYAATFREDFESGTWPTANQEQSTTQQVGAFYYGWYGGGDGSGSWAYSTEKAHSGTHSLKINFPQSDTYCAFPRAKLTSSSSGVTFTEVTMGGWFYFPPNFDNTGQSNKFMNFRMEGLNGILVALDGDLTFHLGWHVPPGYYPEGSPHTIPYERLYVVNSDKSRFHVSRGQWHQMEFYIKPAGDSYTGKLRLKVDGKVMKVTYGATGQEGTGTLIDCDLHDFNFGGSTVDTVDFILNTSSGMPAGQYMYWDDIYVTTGDASSPVNPAGTAAHP